MRRLLKLLGGIMAISVQRELAHRANLVFEAFLTIISTAAGALALTIVYSHVQQLAGWRLEEALVLLGVFQIVSGLLATFVEPNLAWFAGKVVDGQLDDMLLQPVPSLFTASMGVCQPWALVQVALGLVVVGIGAAPLADELRPAGVVGALLLCGIVLTWASRTLLASRAFWAPGFDPSVLYGALWQLGRYPIGIYHPVVQRLLTYVVPVAFIATLPARALTHGASLSLLAFGLAAAGVAGWLTHAVWQAGLRRYTSATS